MSPRLTVDELTRTYEGLEGAEGFVDEAAVADYRAAVLDRNAAQAEFIAALLPEDAELLEIGCGNGRLLIELSRLGRCARGLGLDLAASRIAFARQWASDAGLGGLRFEAADVLKTDVGAGQWDAVMCVTGAFAYFEPLAPGTAGVLAAQMHAALRPGGTLVLELYPHVTWRRMMTAAGTDELRLWQTLPPDDPWRFYLSDVKVDGSTLTHQKTFVHRHDGRIDDSGRREQLHLYTPESLTEVLSTAGFEDVACRAGWSEQAYQQDEFMVVTARRPA